MKQILIWSMTVLLCVHSAQAADIEYRDYRVTVNGKPAGEYRLTITQLTDGTLINACQADVKTTIGLGTYTYTYRGAETWKHGKLLRLDSTTDDNGKKFTVHAMADTLQTKVRVNGVERVVLGELLTTSLWQLPMPKDRNKYGLFLEPDHGKDINAYLQFVDSRIMEVEGAKLTCTHHNLSGPVNIHTYHDPKGALIRLEAIENGQEIVIDLFKVRK